MTRNQKVKYCQLPSLKPKHSFSFPQLQANHTAQEPEEPFTTYKGLLPQLYTGFTFIILDSIHKIVLKIGRKHMKNLY